MNFFGDYKQFVVWKQYPLAPFFFSSFFNSFMDDCILNSFTTFLLFPLFLHL